MCSLRPAPLSYLCVRVRILGVLKIVCCCTIKPDCRLRLLWSHFLTGPAAYVLLSNTPLYYNSVVFLRISLTREKPESTQSRNNVCFIMYEMFELFHKHCFSKTILARVSANHLLTLSDQQDKTYLQNVFLLNQPQTFKVFNR